MRFLMTTQFTSDWMGQIIGPGTRLHDIIMPGSHDAGMNVGDIETNDHGWKKAGATQDLDLFNQLLAGARWFDVRLDVVSGHEGFTAYHGGDARKGRGLSSPGNYGQNSTCSWGQSWTDMLNDIVMFLDCHQTEFLFIRLSKCHVTFWDQLGPTIAGRFEQDQDKLLKNYPHNLIEANAFELTGRCIFLVDDKDVHNHHIHESNGIYRLEKVKGHSPNSHASASTPLYYCGTYSDSTNIKQILGEEMLEATLVKTLKKEMEKASAKPNWRGKLPKVNQAGRLAAHFNGNCGGATNQHLMLLYWTSTAGASSAINPFSTMNVSLNTRTLNQKATISGYLEKVKEALKSNAFHLFNEAQYNYMKETFDTATAKDLFLPNVVMYDFINPTQSKEIIEMNNADPIDFVNHPNVIIDDIDLNMFEVYEGFGE